MPAPLLNMPRTKLDLAAFPVINMSTLKTLLVICPPGTISSAMTAAIESEFPWLNVRSVHDVRLALSAYEKPVQLLLVHAGFAPTLRQYWAEITAIHDGPALALICNSETEANLQGCGVQNFEPVQGVIPFNVNLDVFLSALRIVLKGGQYFLTASRAAAETKERPTAPDGPLAKTNIRAIERLTKRENEILMRIAMGNQNKIIAAALGLSEHTVKIHIHHIITKLGLHNRTEVVAWYFEHHRKDHVDHARTSHDRLPGDLFAGGE